VKLRALLHGIEAEVSGNAEVEVTGLHYDSRRIQPWCLFVAIQGEKADGCWFIPQAIERGAAAVMLSGEGPSCPPVGDRTLVRVADARKALALAAANFYQHPARALRLTGVTGTNGKTTTCYLIESILAAAGYKAGLFGTIEYRLAGRRRPAPHTTPESLDLQAMLAELRDLGGTHAVTEVSSHALALDRVYGCPFHTAVFTNLTRDHLDFHGTMEAYFAEKRKLFDGWGAPPPAWSVLNQDDPWSAQLGPRSQVPGPRSFLTYGLGASADVRPDERKPAPNNGCFTIMTPWGPLESRSPLMGRPNAYNVLAATAAALSLGIDTRTIEAGLAALESVPGRFEQVNAGQPFLVAVDYAHTDDALRSLLATARALLPPGARVITVFGCGGDRDRTKRPLMGEAAGSMSDLVVLTSDNPRSEDPLAIINDALPGLEKTGARYHLEPDRRKAIELAIGEARANDIVLIAGKGHEDYQVIGAQKLHFDDREVACEVLASLGYKMRNGLPLLRLKEGGSPPDLGLINRLRNEE
jgi:UDP-N-acetylmuramoyl-L-alanyl-D-glutamate--2,6-diaminopimelate ligase